MPPERPKEEEEEEEDDVNSFAAPRHRDVSIVATRETFLMRRRFHAVRLGKVRRVPRHRQTVHVPSKIVGGRSGAERATTPFQRHSREYLDPVSAQSLELAYDDGRRQMLGVGNTPLPST